MMFTANSSSKEVKMFSQDDAKVFSLPDNYNKLDAIGDKYFLQLGALLIKANSLIFDIYGVQPSDIYKTSYLPAPSKNRRSNIAFNIKRNSADQALASLKAKGEPKNLTKPNGSFCEMHSASLSFGILNWDDEISITAGFNPYGLTYAQRHRDDFSVWIDRLNLNSIFQNLGIEFQWQSEFGTVSNLIKKQKALLLSPYIPGINPSIEEMAQLVVIFVGMFPLLDLFTRLSNNQNISEIDYPGRFFNWQIKHSSNYLVNFRIEPLKYDIIKVSESSVRDLFESLLGRKFPTIRPSWLKSPKTKANLELDGYCSELNLAFEYQGEYHYVPVPIHHKERSLEEVQKIDEFKFEACKQHGLDLIQVPFWEKGNVSYIKKWLFSLNRPEINLILGKE